MQIKKITEKYNFYKDGEQYVVDFGNVKKAEDKTITLEVTDVEESGLVEFGKTCGCTTTDKTLIDKNKLHYKITYTDCAREFNKVVVVRYNKKQVATILLKGKCQ